MTDCCTLYVTCASKEEAEKIGRLIVEEGLAACANISDNLTSIYKWEGKVVQDNEALLLLKTTSTSSKRTIKRIKEIHSYDIPCICQFEIHEANEEYLNWIKENTNQ